MKNDLKNKAVISEHVLSQAVNGETVLLDLASEQYFGLDAVGTRVWELLQAGKSMEEIRETMTYEFAVSAAQLDLDLVELLQSLTEKGLIRLISDELE